MSSGTLQEGEITGSLRDVRTFQGKVVGRIDVSESSILLTYKIDGVEKPVLEYLSAAKHGDVGVGHGVTYDAHHPLSTTKTLTQFSLPRDD